MFFKKTRKQPEQDQQIIFMQLVRHHYGHLMLPQDPKLIDPNKLYPLWVYHTPNGKNRSITQALALKAMGTTPGIPDITVEALVFSPDELPAYARAVIEFKSSQASPLSNAQKAYRNFCSKAQIQHLIVSDAETAFRFVKNIVNFSLAGIMAGVPK